ncbi:Permease of the drug/metabolite transporter (DMT) superfamily [Pseudobutyrivibrio ruminis]|uniref:Permease of the drug/metabolite transporter (DMT) superfamily n=1 Tax=Pseudobutyrivibrio ruminis TaxID=46206 RepID=A0A1H7IY88_9FIRM|nr:DMT family transporter [Pseudobutyrivibrio ruminis]SEK67368.1 Permease of the drug/metabolite transporter (DMT) superfamily [Pseudobutyrivibrio ruminis]
MESIKKNKVSLSNKYVVCALAIVCCLLWGSAFPSIKIGYRIFGVDAADSMSQILFAGIRFSLAGVLAVIFGSISQKKVLVPKASSWKMICTLSIFQTILQYFFFYIGLAHASGVNASIINGMSTFFAILLACLVKKQEHMTVSKLTGCILGAIGVILVSLSSGSIGTGIAFNGEGFILIASVSYAISSVLIKEYSQHENPVTLSGYQFIIGGIVMIAVGLAGGGRLQQSSGQGVLLIVYLALVSSVAYSVWGLLLKYNPVSTVTVYGFTNPIFGALLSAIFLREWGNISWKSLVALALVSAGIYIVNSGKMK